jgi:hypothetical protein
MMSMFHNDAVSSQHVRQPSRAGSPDASSSTIPSRLTYNPVTLAIRFFLELASFVAFGFSAWHLAPGGLRWLAALVLPAAVAAAWGVFAVPGDPSRSGRAPVPTPGPVRLLLELSVFFGSAVALAAAHVPTIATSYAIILVVYHITAYARIRWLLIGR